MHMQPWSVTENSLQTDSGPHVGLFWNVEEGCCVRGETESHTFGIDWQAILCNYFEAGGASAQLILPKQLALQYLLLCQKPPQRSIADPDDDDFYDFVDDDDDDF
jgi:hypothetical protein